VTSLSPLITVENQRNIKHFLMVVDVGNRNGEQSISDENNKQIRVFPNYSKINLLKSSSKKQ
jgi:hypothetical protein